MNETKAVSMTFKKKLLIVLVALVSVVAIVVTSVLATVAYLTSSAAVSNVFTVGNVGIVMDEAKVDKDGKPIANAARVDTNTYHLVPNKTYYKDPTITVNAGSENSYLFCLVRNDIELIAKKDDPNCPPIATQLKNFGWAEYTQASTGKVYVYVGFDSEGNSKVPADGKFAEGTSKAVAVEAGQKYKLFEKFTIAENADVSNYGAAKITLTAVAIQIAGFENDLAGAWTAVKKAHPYIHTGAGTGT